MLVFRSPTVVSATFALLGIAACSGESGSDGGGGGGGSNVPQIPQTCEGFDAQDAGSPDVVISGDDCNEDTIRGAVEAGGVIRLECPGPVPFTEQMVVRSDTVVDGAGMTVLDGGGTTRFLMKWPGADLHVQNITLQNGHTPTPEEVVDQANWFDYAGGAILAQGHLRGQVMGGTLFAKNLTCIDNATGPNARDAQTGQILDTGTGGCVFVFHGRFHCDGCELTGNRATLGGAVGSLGSKILMTNSTCVDNTARFDGSTNENQGFGGCHYQDGTETAPGEDETNYVHMCGNYMANNAADASGGAVSLFYRQGTRTSFVFTGNVCEANSGGDSGELNQGGGCLYSYVDTNTTIDWAPDEGPDEYIISGNAFIGNSAEYIGGGAVIYNVWQTATRFDNNLFLRNEVRTTDQMTGGGGGLGLIGAFFDVEHNTFIGNHANNWVGGLFLGVGGVALRNNLFFDNSAPTIRGGPVASTEHVNAVLDDQDDGDPNGFLVYASGGNLYSPGTTPGGGSRPTPGAALVDVDPGVGELVREGFPYYVPLSPDSPAVDAGVAVDTVTTDMRGVPRRGTPDIGAVEAD